MKGVWLQAQEVALAKPRHLNHARASYERLLRKVLGISTIGLPMQSRMILISTRIIGVIDAKGVCYEHNKLSCARLHDLNPARASFERLMRKVLVISTTQWLLQGRMIFILHAHHMIDAKGVWLQAH